MKYWIYVLDALIRKPQKSIHADIAQLLVWLVESGQVTCPAHYTVFCEVLKQGNRTRRQDMARLVDHLSGGVAIQPPKTLLEAELLHMWTVLTKGADTVYPLEQIVWLPVANICGEMIPVCPALDEKTNAALQKSHYDLMSVMTLEAMVDALGSVERVPVFEDDSFSDRLTQQAAEHRHEYHTFGEVFMHEVAGLLDLIRPEIESMLKHIHLRDTGHTQGQEDPKAVATCTQLAINAIYALFKHRKIGKQFPSAHIGSSIHAAMRYMQRPFKPGDLHDHFHAQAALPYCNVFLTERSLGTLLTCKHLQLDKEYRCRVLWDEEDVMKELRTIGNGHT